MLSTLLLLATSAAAPLKLASPGLSYTGIDPMLANAIIDRFVTELGRSGGFKVTTQNDIIQVLGLDRQKQLLGCTDAATTSCLAELAGALGVDAILTGSLAKIGSGYTVTLRVVKANDGTEVATASTRAKDEEALQDWLDGQARELGARIRDGLAPAGAPPPAVTSSTSVASVLPWVTVGIGAVLLGGGGISFALGKGDASTLGMPVPVTNIDALAEQGSLRERLGVGLMISGAIVLAAAVVWMLVMGPGDAP